MYQFGVDVMFNGALNTRGARGSCCSGWAWRAVQAAYGSKVGKAEVCSLQ